MMSFPLRSPGSIRSCSGVAGPRPTTAMPSSCSGAGGGGGGGPGDGGGGGGGGGGGIGTAITVAGIVVSGESTSVSDATTVNVFVPRAIVPDAVQEASPVTVNGPVCELVTVTLASDPVCAC